MEIRDHTTSICLCPTKRTLGLYGLSLIWLLREATILKGSPLSNLSWRFKGYHVVPWDIVLTTNIHLHTFSNIRVSFVRCLSATKAQTCHRLSWAFIVICIIFKYDTCTCTDILFSGLTNGMHNIMSHVM